MGPLISRFEGVHWPPQLSPNPESAPISSLRRSHASASLGLSVVPAGCSADKGGGEVAMIRDDRKRQQAQAKATTRTTPED